MAPAPIPPHPSPPQISSKSPQPHSMSCPHTTAYHHWSTNCRQNSMHSYSKPICSSRALGKGGKNWPRGCTGRMLPSGSSPDWLSRGTKIEKESQWWCRRSGTRRGRQANDMYGRQYHNWMIAEECYGREGHINKIILNVILRAEPEEDRLPNHNHTVSRPILSLLSQQLQKVRSSPLRLHPTSRPSL